MQDPFGWIGFGISQMIAWPQLARLRRRGAAQGVSLLTYFLLLLAMVFYLLHALRINDGISVLSIAFGFVPNLTILALVARSRLRRSAPSTGSSSHAVQAKVPAALERRYPALQLDRWVNFATAGQGATDGRVPPVVKGNDGARLAFPTVLDARAPTN